MIRFVSALAVALSLFAAAGPSMAQVAASPDLPVERNEAWAAALVQALKLHYPFTLAYVEAEFPEDHAALIASVEEIGGAAEAHPEQLLLAAFGELTKFRAKYAEKVTFAPAAAQSIMLGFLAEFYEKVFAGEGAAVCGRFANDGSAVLFELGLSGKYVSALDRQSLAYFQAVVAGIETPEYHEVARPEDWAIILAGVIASGGPESYVAAIAEGRPDNPELCPALATMFRVSGVLDTPEGARTRADLTKNLSGY